MLFGKRSQAKQQHMLTGVISWWKTLDLSPRSDDEGEQTHSKELQVVMDILTCGL